MQSMHTELCVLEDEAPGTMKPVTSMEQHTPPNISFPVSVMKDTLQNKERIWQHIASVDKVLSQIIAISRG